MRVLFYNARFGDVWDKLFSIFDLGKFSRVQIDFGPGKRYGVNLKNGKFQKNPPLDDNNDKGKGKDKKNSSPEDNWESIELPLHEEEVLALVDGFKNVSPKHLNWLAKVCGWLFPQIAYRLFASVIIAICLDGGGYDGAKSHVTPNKLYKFLKDWLADHQPPYYGMKKQDGDSFVFWE